MKSTVFTTFTLCVTLIVPQILAQDHSDIRPRVGGGKILTDGFEDGPQATTPNIRVFGYDFGENVDDPFLVADPGINAAVGSGLSEGAAFQFNLLSNLRFWDGTGGVAFSAVTTGETLDVNFGAQTRTLAGSSVPQAGFTIQAVGAGGTLHRHLNAFLNGPDGNTLPAGAGSWGPGDGVQAADGVYLFSMQLLQSPAGGIAASDPIYILYNNGLDEELHDEAMNWVTANLVPEPGSVCLVGIGMGVLALKRCRRRRFAVDLP